MFYWETQLRTRDSWKGIYFLQVCIKRLPILKTLCPNQGFKSLIFNVKSTLAARAWLKITFSKDYTNKDFWKFMFSNREWISSKDNFILLSWLWHLWLYLHLHLYLLESTLANAQDYGGHPTIFGIASVINHVSEMGAYFYSFKAITKYGHVKVREKKSRRNI